MRYLYVSLLALLFASCEDITVGYLDAENATYGIDSLVVDKVAISKIDEDVAAHSETYYTDLVAEFQNYLYSGIDFYDDYDELEGKYFELVDNTDHLLTAAESAKVDGYYQDATFFKGEADKGNPALYKSKIWSSYNYARYYLDRYVQTRMKRHTDDIPWVTNAMQGIEGTFPLRYTIANIRSVNKAENSKQMEALFNDPNAEKYTGIRGNGSIQVPYRTNLPDDTYYIDVRISNEGREYVQPDVLRIIIK
jgi:hypothetical protein